MAATTRPTTSYGTNRGAFSNRDWVIFVSLALIWGSSFLLMAIGLDHFHPGLITLIRVSFGAGVLTLMSGARGRTVDRGDWGRITLLGAIWVAIPFTLFPIAQQWVDSAVAGMLNGATPIFTTAVAALLFRSPPGRMQVTGLFVGFAGILAIALPSAGGGTTAAIGVVLIIVATIGYAVSLNLVPPLQQRYGSLTVMVRVLWVGTAMVAPFGLYGLGQSAFAWDSLLSSVAIGVLGTGLAFVMMGNLVGSVGATRASFLTYLIPVVALVLGVVFRDERISLISIVGTAMVILGALLASRSETRAVDGGSA